MKQQLGYSWVQKRKVILHVYAEAILNWNLDKVTKHIIDNQTQYETLDCKTKHSITE